MHVKAFWQGPIGQRSFRHDTASRLYQSVSLCMATAKKESRSTGRSIAPQGNPNFEASSSAPQSSDDAILTFRPLRAVVKDAVKRWFNEAHKEAVKGDTKQQALLGQMMIEGYGCKQDPDLGREWTERARKRGYRMAGVYCEI